MKSILFLLLLVALTSALQDISTFGAIPNDDTLRAQLANQ